MSESTNDVGERANRAGLRGGLGALHDAVSRASFVAAATLLAAIALSFSYEVVARYLFNAPTSWANALVSYLLCGAIFLAVPELTRRRSHIAINLLLERIAPNRARVLQKGILVLAAAACLFAAWFSGNETLSQYAQGIQTISAYPIPKWWVSIFIPYGLLSAGLHFLRQLLATPQSAVVSSGLTA